MDNDNPVDRNPLPSAADIRKQSTESTADVENWLAGTLASLAGWMNNHAVEFNRGDRVLFTHPSVHGDGGRMVTMWAKYHLRVKRALEERGYKVEIEQTPITQSGSQVDQLTSFRISLPTVGGERIISE